MIQAGKPQRFRKSRLYRHVNRRITGGKQSHLVTAAYELFRQIRHNSLRATIELGRHTFVKRSDLSDTQRPRRMRKLGNFLLRSCKDHSNSILEKFSRRPATPATII